MIMKDAINVFSYHQKSSLKPKSINSYSYILKQFETDFAERDFESICTDEVRQFLEDQTTNYARATRRTDRFHFP